MRDRLIICATLLAFLLPAGQGFAQAPVPRANQKKNAPLKASEPKYAEGPQLPPQPLVLDIGKTVQSTPWSIIALLTAITLLPSILMAVTPFVRLLVIFHFLRQALGTQTIPTNQTIIGLCIFLTYFVMQPVCATVYKDAIVPLQAGKIEVSTALDRGTVPVKDFMLHYTREKDLALFVELAKEPRPNQPKDLTMRVVIPAYIISELKAGFQIGAVLFLPFLVIDMAVASITTSVGMMQLPPVVISTPLKILVFVMADGWNLLVGSILRSFY